MSAVNSPSKKSCLELFLSCTTLSDVECPVRSLLRRILSLIVPSAEMLRTSFLIRLLMCTAAFGAAELESHDPGWPFWGGNLNNTRSTSLSTLVNQISIANLTVAFSVSLLGPVSAAPFVYGSVVVVPTWAGQLYSLDSSTGAIQWQRAVDEYVASSLCDRPTEYNFTEGPTGVISRTTPALAGPDLIVIGTQVADPLVAGLPYIMGELLLVLPRRHSRPGLLTHVALKLSSCNDGF